MNRAEIIASERVLLLILQIRLPYLDLARNLIQQPFVIRFDLQLPLVLRLLDLDWLLVAQLEHVDA